MQHIHILEPQTCYTKYYLTTHLFKELLVFIIRKVAKNYGYALSETITFMSMFWSWLLNESGYSNRNRSEYVAHLVKIPV